MRDRLFLTISRGPHAASARPLLVSDDEKLIREVARVVGSAMGLDADRVEHITGGPLPGKPQLVKDPQTGSGHYDLDGFDPDRRVELVRFGDEGVIVESQNPPLLDAAFDLVQQAEPDSPVDSPSRREFELRLYRADAASYGSLKPAGSSTHPDVLAAFIHSYIESSASTDGECEILRSLLPEIAEAAELERVDEAARREWDTARRARDAAKSELESQKNWAAGSRRSAVAARNRLDEAKRKQLRPSESKLAELEREALEAENALDAAEEKLEAAKAAAIEATVLEHEARVDDAE